MPEVGDVFEFDVCLNKKKGQGFGLNIYEKIGTTGVFVSNVFSGTVAAKEGSIRQGDQILNVNGENVTEAPKDYVANLLRCESGQVRLKIGRRKHYQPTASENPSHIAMLLADIERESIKLEQIYSLQKANHEFETSPRDCFVEIAKNPSKQLGIDIAGGVNSHLGNIPVFIASVQPDGPASGKLKTGDKILSINGQTTENKTHEEIVWMIKGSGDAILLMKVRRGEEDVEKLVEYLTNASDTVSQMINSSLDLDILPDTPPKHMESEQPEKPATAWSRPEVEKRLEVTLDQGEDGLGFSVVGGTDSIHGDLPIFVKSVFNSGPAASEGRLQRGDRILAVNGESLDGCTHKEGVALLKKAKGKVVLTVIPI